ncbi:LrgB family protein [Fusibacter bizertensis]|uniref:LrgB family protein n=1 Tax=Fusibacter bizertensis TaxID=1488331 RepID=A0ABT6NBB6_9FIRM|nr:LrgB family protein [Fusibacter bizertensis]MDH8677716.1 LrgB family protein [Fusibacter bizertensis]
MLLNITETPAFGILISILGYALGGFVKNKTKSVLANPILIAVIFIVAFLIIFDIPYEHYKIGGDGIHYFLGPLTVALGMMLYRQRHIIRTNFISLLVGITSGVLTSFFTIIFLSKWLGLDEMMMRSLVPKSITTPMALSLVEINGGNPVITVVMVIITGIVGALVAPLFVKWFPSFDKIAVGVGIGTSSHGVGTSKAIELGETEGALSSTAIGLAGLLTIILVPPLFALFF